MMISYLRPGSAEQDRHTKTNLDVQTHTETARCLVCARIYRALPFCKFLFFCLTNQDEARGAEVGIFLPDKVHVH